MPKNKYRRIHEMNYFSHLALPNQNLENAETLCGLKGKFLGYSDGKLINCINCAQKSYELRKNHAKHV